MQSPGGDHGLFVLFAFGLDLFEDLQLASVRQAFVLVEHPFEQESGLPPKRISVPRPAMLVAMVTAAFAAGLRDNFSLFFMELGIEHVVLDAVAAQISR